MNSKKKILVFGATGAQGGSVARNLLARGSYDVRALTRKTDSPAAQALRELGAEIVQGDLDDPASIRAALEGCYGAFGVTNFWEHFQKEEQQGRNLVEAVAAAKIEHFVFSTLPPIEKATNGALKSPHFDLKAEHEEQARALGIPTTFIHVPFYYENFLYFFPPRPTGDGMFQFGFPQGDTPLAAMSVQDVGRIVAVLFEQPAQYIGKTLKLAGDELPAAAYADAMSRRTGSDIRYAYIPRETFAAFGFPGAEDLADMFEFYRLHIPSRAQDIETCRALAPELQSFETWVARNEGNLRAMLGHVA
ncbi:MAG TPA: NmrA/HSCARG family protein [Thermoanaerobaculia bacterium]|nr:NmrA/HSCARG family protein [Thermoanaerobaculia bacterium]